MIRSQFKEYIPVHIHSVSNEWVNNSLKQCVHKLRDKAIDAEWDKSDCGYFQCESVGIYSMVDFIIIIIITYIYVRTTRLNFPREVVRALTKWRLNLIAVKTYGFYSD